MKKTFVWAVLLAAVSLASCDRDQYRIHGRVTSNELDGIQVFLVSHPRPCDIQ